MTNLESDNGNGKNLSPRQFSAIKRGIDFGRILVEEHPEIADFYREGISQEKIAEMLDLKSKYGNSNSVTRTGVIKSLSGHEGGFGSSEFEGLIPDSEERSRLSLEHKVEQGFKTLREKTGVFGRTSEKRTEDAIKSVISRGQTPWKKQGDHLGNEIYCAIDELDYAHHLAQQPEFQENGKMKRNKVKQIAIELNKLYHQGESIRTSRKVIDLLGRIRESLGIERKKRVNLKKQGDHLGNEIYCAIDELDYAHHLAQQPEFTYSSGRHKGRKRSQDIANELNKLYHQSESVRSANNITSILSPSKKYNSRRKK